MADILQRDDGLLGEGLDKPNVVVRERRNLATVEHERTDTDSVLQQRHGHDRAGAFHVHHLHAAGITGAIEIGVSHIVEPDHTVGHGTDGDQFGAVDRLLEPEQDLGEVGPRAALRRDNDLRAGLIRKRQERERRPAKARGVLQDDVENRRLVVAGAADDVQDLARRLFALQPDLKLLELPDVLDGDDGLYRSQRDSGRLPMTAALDS